MSPVRFHHLRAAGRSGAHAKLALTTESKPTAAMLLGKAVHALVLDNQAVLLFDGAARRGKAWESFSAANPGAIILTEPEFARAEAMAQAVRDHGDARRFIHGSREQTLLWDMDGRPCRATPDAYNDDLVELKTARSAEPGAFTRDAVRYAYHAQLAWYSEAMRRCLGHEPRDVYIVAVESSPPYPVTVLRLTGRALDKGARLWRLWWERLRLFEQSNEWPGYVESVMDFDVPDDDELTFGDDEEAT